MTIRISRLEESDHDAWLVLAHGYKAFYKTEVTDADYAIAWRRLRDDEGIHALAGWIDGRLVGITHYLFHTAVWTPTVCYLQDLFVDPGARGQGVARALIEAVAAAARERQATRLYWMTQETNATARKLYDQVARYHGFIRYDFPMN